MNRLTKIITLSLALLFSLTIAYAESGVVISTTTKELKSGKISTTKLFLISDKIMVQNTGGGNFTILFDATSEVFTYIDNNKKEYYELDNASLVQLKQQLKMVVQMMKQFATQMPESEKKKLDRFLNPDTGQLMEYSLVKDNEKIGKWKTSKYEGKNESKKYLELNIASFGALGIDKEKFEILSVFTQYIKSNLKDVLVFLPVGGSFSQLDMNENSPVMTKGLPIKTISFRDDGTLENENLVNKIEETDIDSGLFTVPAGYVAQEINIQQQMGR